MGLREYGLGDYTQYIIGRPRLVETISELGPHKADCPNCHMDKFCSIEVVLKAMPLLNQPYGLGSYLSCPACPWASRMVVMGIDKLPTWWKEVE
jgi:hypothetical protein